MIFNMFHGMSIKSSSKGRVVVYDRSKVRSKEQITSLSVSRGRVYFKSWFGSKSATACKPVSKSITRSGSMLRFGSRAGYGVKEVPEGCLVVYLESKVA